MTWLLPVWILAIPLLTIVVELIRTPRANLMVRPREARASAASPGLPSSLASTDNSEDVVRFLLRQHEEIKSLFAQTLAATGADRAALFVALRRLVATHEATEEALFHPEAKAALGPKGQAVIAARIAEERSAAAGITTLEKMTVDSLQFEVELRKLQYAVEQHAMHEEQQEFPALAGADPSQLQRVREVAQSLYAGGQMPAGLNRDIGPFVALVNETRDLLTHPKTLATPAVHNETFAQATLP